MAMRIRVEVAILALFLMAALCDGVPQPQPADTCIGDSDLCSLSFLQKSSSMKLAHTQQNTQEEEEEAVSTCNDWTEPHKTCSGTPTILSFQRSAECEAGSWRDCDNEVDRNSCRDACTEVGASGCCSFRAHLVSANGDGSGCQFFEGSDTIIGNGNSDIYASLCQAPDGYACENDKNYRSGDIPEDLAGTVHSGISSQSACQTLCDSTSGCKVYVFNNYGACYLKAEVTTIEDDDPTHGTISCKAPEGNCENGQCTVYGDPHVSGFDLPSLSPEAVQALFQMDSAPQEETQGVVGPGNYWLVKSERVHVQGRYENVYYPKAKLTAHQVYMTTLAVGGPFLQGRTLVIEPRNGRVLWNHREILGSLPSKFEDGSLIQAKYRNDTAFVHDPTQYTTGIDVELPSDVKLTVNRFEQHLGIALAMPRSAGGQNGMDGQCGNFNCDANDDTVALIAKRVDLRVAEDDLLFKR